MLSKNKYLIKNGIDSLSYFRFLQKAKLTLAV